MKLSHPLILGSNSPRRKQLLKDLGFDFKQKVYPTDESFSKEMPSDEVAEFLATKKAKAYDKEAIKAIILTADTIVVLKGKILGKPNDGKEAIEMLTALSGQSHQVISGVCLRNKDNYRTISDITTVHFKQLTQEEIYHYVSTYKPFDKAGGYGIQEWIGQIGINKIEGSYYNVVGLPVHKVYELLGTFQK